MLFCFHSSYFLLAFPCHFRITKWTMKKVPFPHQATSLKLCRPCGVMKRFIILIGKKPRTAHSLLHVSILDKPMYSAHPSRGPLSRKRLLLRGNNYCFYAEVRSCCVLAPSEAFFAFACIQVVSVDLRGSSPHWSVAVTRAWLKDSCVISRRVGSET